MGILNKLFFILIISIFSVSSAFADDFCKGFEKGYITGYKQSSGSSFDPFTPFCPFQPMKGFNDPESDFEHGYIIGLGKGMQEGSKNN